MSRGGRGGGRGGGSSGRGGGVFGTGSSLMGGLTYTQVMDSAKELQESKKLFPQAPLPEWHDPTHREQEAYRYMDAYLDKMQKSAYHVGIAEEEDVNKMKYTDRYHDSFASIPDLSTPGQMARMNKDFFPTQTWNSFFEKKARLAKRKKSKKSATTVLAGEENAEEGADGKQGEQGSDQEEEEQDEFDDEEENPDYDNNYFETGDDDDEDAGGGGDAEPSYDG